MAVIFNQEDNPGLFKKDSRYILKRFDLYGKKCVLISEGKKVSLISNFGNEKEEELLSAFLPLGMEGSINTLILKWYNNCVSLYADASLVNSDNTVYLKQNIGELCHA